MATCSLLPRPRSWENRPPEQLDLAPGQLTGIWKPPRSHKWKRAENSDRSGHGEVLESVIELMGHFKNNVGNISYYKNLTSMSVYAFSSSLMAFQGRLFFLKDPNLLNT